MKTKELNKEKRWKEFNEQKKTHLSITQKNIYSNKHIQSQEVKLWYQSKKVMMGRSEVKQRYENIPPTMISDIWIDRTKSSARETNAHVLNEITTIK